RRVAFGDPAKHEERGTHLVFRQKVQQAPRVADDPARLALPARAVDHRFEGVDLKVLLHVNSQRIDHLIHHDPWLSDTTSTDFRPLLLSSGVDGRLPMTFAGIPATITFSSVMLRVTTAPAATTTPLAMRVPAVTITCAPSQTSSPMTIEASLRSCSVIGRAISMLWLLEKRQTPGPMSRLSPRIISEFSPAQTQQRWLMCEFLPT